MTKDMTQGSPARLILGFALPMLAGMLFQQLYNLVDTMIVGRFLGVNALAGVGATGSINFLVLGFCMGLCSGFSIPVAQRFGAREEGEMRAFAANSVWLSMGMSVVLMVLTVVFCRDILTLMDTPAECFDEAYGYIVVIFAGIPFIVLYNLLSGFLRSLGDSKTPLFFLVLSSALNVALDLVFILSFHMGVVGAALATVISQAVSGLLCLGFIALRVPVLHARSGEWRVRRDMMLNLCGYGVPMGMQYSVTAIGSVILQAAINSLGAVAVAAVTAAGRVMGFFSCPIDAMGSTMATYAAQNVGARRYDRLNRGLFASSALGFGYSALSFVVALLFGPKLMGLFITGDANAQIIALGHEFMMVNLVFYPLLTLVNTVRFTIQGMGFSVLAICSGALEMVARSLSGIVLVPALGFFGAALGSPLAWIFADIFLIPAYLLCRGSLMGRSIRFRRRADKLVYAKPGAKKGLFLKKGY